MSDRATGPPAHLLTGQVGSQKWHKNTNSTVKGAKGLTQNCGKEALNLWRPPEDPNQPEETPYERKVKADSWKFKLDVLATGEVRRKPPEGPGVTLWKSKIKPPPWICKLALPCFRDFSNTKNNEFIAQYCRETRLVVSRLRQALVEINEQFKALVHERARLDATLAKIRQGLLTNKQSQVIREHRPTSEKVRPASAPHACTLTLPNAYTVAKSASSMCSHALSHLCQVCLYISIVECLDYRVHFSNKSMHFIGQHS